VDVEGKPLGRVNLMVSFPLNGIHPDWRELVCQVHVPAYSVT
jgi:hypothetical protein